MLWLEPRIVQSSNIWLNQPRMVAVLLGRCSKTTRRNVYIRQQLLHDGRCRLDSRWASCLFCNNTKSNYGVLGGEFSIAHRVFRHGPCDAGWTAGLSTSETPLELRRQMFGRCNSTSVFDCLVPEDTLSADKNIIYSADAYICFIVRQQQLRGCVSSFKSTELDI
jgi:hypothetical protein